MDRKVTSLTTCTIIDEAKKTHHRVCVKPVLDPARVGYRCMYCTLPIETKPIGLPTNLIEKVCLDSKHAQAETSYEFSTYGVFCSYNCVKAYILANSYNPLYKKSVRYLAMMLSYEKYGKVDEPITIVPSPPRDLLAIYGGYMTLEQYKNEIGTVKYESHGLTAMFPLTSVFTRVEN
jgi:hypothetical protein